MLQQFIVDQGVMKYSILSLPINMINNILVPPPYLAPADDKACGGRVKVTASL